MKRRVSTEVMFVFLAMVFTLALAPASSAQPGEFVKGVLQPLADGFPNQPITLVSPDEAASRDGMYCRAIQAALKDISPVPIRVSDEPVNVGGLFDKIKETMDRPGGSDGYYPISCDIWGSSTDTLAYDTKRDLGLEISDMNMVIVTDRMNNIILQRKNTPWGPTFMGMVKYAKENPGKVRFSVTEVGSGSMMAGCFILATVGILDKVQQKPQGSMTAADTVVGAGECDFSFSRMDSALPHIQAGRADVTVFTTFIPPPFDKNPNIVTLGQLGIGFPNEILGYYQGFVVPKQVPDSHREWLFKLFKAGASTPQYKENREKTFIGLRVGDFLDPAAANALKMKMVTMGEPIIRSLGLHWDQQKK